MPAGADKYVNVLLHECTMSGIDTLTYSEINIGLSTFDRIGLMLHRASFYPSASTIANFEGDADFIQLAITGSNAPTDIGSDERSVFAKVESFLNFQGTPATIGVYHFPMDIDLTGMPGGGLLIPPRPLYFAAMTNGFGAAGVFYLRMYFTTVQLRDTEYFELLETFRFFE